jgi:HAD superfamily hydrolase (TIGR01509 family)
MTSAPAAPTSANAERVKIPRAVRGLLAISRKDWQEIAIRAWQEASDDNIGLAAAGVAFYAFLAMVPLLGAVVLSYGLIAEPETVIRNMHQLTSVMPADAAKLIGEQLMNVVQTSGGKKGAGLVLALGIALFGARNGAGAIIIALNIAYEEKEKRGIIALNLLSLAMTVVAVAVAALAMIAIAMLGHLEELLPSLPDWVSTIGKALLYFLLTGVAAAGASTLYRYGPSRENAHWIWITPGSLFAAVLWLLLTIGFGIYVANFGSYTATYGSLGAVVVLLTWLYLSSYVLLFGAEINSEFEHQTSPAEEGASTATEPTSQLSDKAIEPVPLPFPEPPRSSERNELMIDFGAGRVTAGGLHVAGFGKVGLVTSALATLGLSTIRRGSSPIRGMMILAAAGGIAWLRRAPRARNRIKAVLFDLDGTLVDSNDFHITVWQQVLREYGQKITRAAIHEQIGKGGDLLLPALLPGIGEADRRALSDAHGVLFKHQYIGRVKPFPDARGLIERAHKAGQRVVLASSATQEELDHYMDLLDARDMVDASTSIDDVEHSKPAPDIFATALKKAGIGPEEAIVVGDTPYDIQAAAACGIRTVAVRSGSFSDAQLAGAVAIYSDVASLAHSYSESPLAQ